MNTDFLPQTHTEKHRHIYPYFLFAVYMMTLICGRLQINSWCRVLFVAIKTNLHSVRPSRKGSEWPMNNKLFCYVCVFLCESVAIIKVSSIRLAAFQASEAHICHYHLRAFIRIPGWISCYSISNLRSRPIGID